MQIVIDIPDEIYKKYMDDRVRVTDVLHAVRHGTPLPKGCGRLIDGDKLLDDIEKQYPASVSETDKCKRYARLVYYWAVKNSQTVIEADKGSEDNACLDEGNTR